MNENRNAHDPEKAPPPHGCVRGGELVAYLYGESSPAEAELFRRHLEACAACREEVAAFGAVREGLGEWRAEVLGSVPPLGIREAIAPAAEVQRGRERSAAAALREFFSLSPLWLRAGSVTAVLAACALAALTLARAELRWDADGLAFRTGVAERGVTERAQPPAPAGYTAEQVEAIVAERLGAERARWQAAQEAQAGREIVNASAQPQRRVAAPAAARSNAPRPARATPRGPDPDEESADLPRLSDLLSGSY